MALEDYTRGEILGRGAFGTVVRATGPAGEVAIKLLAIPTLDRLKRFERELDMTLRLGRTPGFVPVIEGGVSGQQAYLIMPLFEGGTLRQRLRHGRLSPTEACQLVARLADAMGSAHAEGVVHRDLKPENVLFDGDGRAFVADMGLARWIEGVSEHSLGLSKSGQMRGTVGYMPPEQLHSARSVTPTADVFALGAILHECLSGEPAFGRDTALAVVARIEEGRCEQLDPRALGVSPGVVRLIERCLDPSPEKRLPHGTALANALRAPETLATPSRRSRQSLVVAAVLAVLGLVGGVAVLATRADPEVRLDDGGDGLPQETAARLRAFQTLRWVDQWGSEVGQLGEGGLLFPLRDGFLTGEPSTVEDGYDLTRWSANGVRAGTPRRVPVAHLSHVDLSGRVLNAYVRGLGTVHEREGSWPKNLADTEADCTDARSFDGRVHWLGHRPGPEDTQGAALCVHAEGAPLSTVPFPEGVWRNGEVLFLGAPQRAVFVVAEGDGAEPQRT